MSHLFRSPLVLAVLITLANAAKPVTVDDTAYLTYARHIAHHPLDPYGFEVFWWEEPEPAMHVLCPPVLPYWLAVGMRFVGDSPVLLKVWLFPFVWLLAWAFNALLVRFARGMENVALPLLLLSPAVLPTVNVMLDVPTLALGLASVEVFLRGMGRKDWRFAILAGLLAGLAMQTKYTALIVPVVFAWAGLTRRQFVPATIAVVVSVSFFVGWELLLVQQYNESHFAYRAGRSSGASTEGGGLRALLDEKKTLIPPLVGQLGCLAVGVGLLAGSVIRFPRRWLIALAVLWVIGFVLVCTLPDRWMIINPELTATTVFWQTSGWCWFAAIVGCVGMLLFRVKKGLGLRFSTDAWFLVGWLAIEIAAAIVLSPFPAARRVMGITLVAGIVVAFAASRIQRAHRERRPPRWVFATGIAAGVAVAGIDTLDAFPEKVCAELAADVVQHRSETSAVWYVGHWGFQYYCERAGMQPLIAGKTVAHAGDFVVIPAYPDEGFNRPFAGFEVFYPPENVADEVATVQWNDWLSAQTVPNFYGGGNPIIGRDHARLCVRIYRLRADWTMRK